MAIFAKDDSRTSTSSDATLIAVGASIQGIFNLDSRLHVDGFVEGDIKSSSVVVIGKKGRVKGELKAEKLIISGEFEGNADCTFVEVLEGGRFIGSVHSKELMIESKAFFQGQSNVKTSEDMLQIVHEESVSE